MNISGTKYISGTKIIGAINNISHTYNLSPINIPEFWP